MTDSMISGSQAAIRRPPLGATSADPNRTAYRAVPSQQVTADNLGPLQDLPGFWEGTGYNVIARPTSPATARMASSSS